MKSLYWNITLSLVFLFSINVVKADLADGLIAVWLFDGNLRDSVGKNDGEFMGSSTSQPSTPTSKPGPVNTADGITSTWTFNDDADDIVGGNDGELMTGKAKPPANENKPQDKPTENSGTVNIADGIVSTWTFDGDADDDIEDNDGEINGAPLLKSGPEYVDGKFGRALKFDGVDDYVQIPDDDSLHFPEGMTVTAWINVTAGADHAAVCWKGEKIGWGDNFSWRIATRSNNTDITWGRCTTGAEQNFDTNGVIPATGEWVHLAMTCMAPGAVTNQRAYVNGEDVSPQGAKLSAEPPFLIFEGEPVEIGVGRAVGGTVGNDAYFNGIIDEVGIWDRGLNANEIEDVMTNGLPFSYSVNARNKIATTWGKLKK